MQSQLQEFRSGSRRDDISSDEYQATKEIKLENQG
jgi:hypothetical protein